MNSLRWVSASNSPPWRIHDMHARGGARALRHLRPRTGECLARNAKDGLEGHYHSCALATPARVDPAEAHTCQEVR